MRKKIGYALVLLLGPYAKLIAMNGWELCDHYDRSGIEGTRSYIGEKILIGILDDGLGLYMDDLLRASTSAMSTQPDLLIAYVTEAVIEALGLDAFSGFIFPGCADKYPRNRVTFTAQDMPEHKRSPKERLFQKLYPLTDSARIPTLGLCGGAQHLVLSRQGALRHSKIKSERISLDPFHVPHFMALNGSERISALESCASTELVINVYRTHSFCAVLDRLGHNLTLASKEDQTPLAFYDGFKAIAVQFHAESYYQGIKANADASSEARQTQLVHTFFALCRQHQRYITWAKTNHEDRSEALTRRDSMNQKILDRLKACRENALHAAQESWSDWVDF
ncbi:MAG: hypothetical protein B7X06_03365 [Verrucomicrobia bacterium 21-51-4]|nr:MAG: hypothetical protein B7X06_03365 [Verrucomicrobia bacterium 21-51-4]HQU09544.1 gamma-glutamyl-gamma-aminobutyrate hydrolase family protein [Opitutales bacterium]